MKKSIRIFILIVAPWAVLFCSLLLSCAVWRFEKDSARAQVGMRFEQETREIQTDITRRLNDYELMLRGVTGLFDASFSIARDQWRSFYTAIDPRVNYPGLQAIGYVQLVRAAGKTAFEQQVRSEGLPDYAIWPAGDRPAYYPVVYIEPFSGRNLRALGYDLISERARRAALEEARDSGRAAITSRITLVQETDSDVQPGFLMFLPLYEKNRALKTVSDRIKAIKGMVYCAFRMNDFMRESVRLGPGVAWEVYDGGAASPEALYYSSSAAGAHDEPGNEPLFQRTSAIDLFGRTWTMRYSSMPELEKGEDLSRAIIGTCASALISLMLFAIVFLIAARTRQLYAEALRQAEEKKLLRLSEEKYRAIFEGMSQGAFMQSADGSLIDVNPAALRIFGLTREEFLNRTSFTPAWQVIRDDGSPMPPEEHPSMAALASGKPVLDATAGVYNFILGRYVWLTINAMPQTMPGHARPYQVFVTLHDMTAQRQAAEDLRRASDKWRTTFDAMVDPVALVVPDGTVQQCNRAFAQLIALDFENILGCAYDRLIRVSGEAAEWPVSRAAISRARELQEVKFSGSVFILSADPVLEPGGEVSGFICVLRDITEQRRMEDALLQAENILSDAQQLASLGHWTFNWETSQISWSDEIYRILGLPVGTALSYGGFLRCVHPDDYEVFRRAWQDLDNKPTRIKIEYRILRPGGEIRHVRDCSIYKYESGGMIGAAGLLMDITEQRRIEQSLLQTEDLLSEAQQLARIGSWKLDLERNLPIWSDEIYRILGLPAGSPISNTGLLDFVHPDDYASLSDAYHAGYGPSNFEFEYRILRPDGEVRHILDYQIYKYEEGKLLGAAGLVQDITERKLFEKALRESEETSLAMLNATGDAVVLMDRSGCILAANEAMARRLGMGQQAVAGRSYFDLFPEKMREQTLANFSTVMRSGQPLCFEDGYAGTVLDICFYPVFDGWQNVSRVAVFARDITGRRRAEQALQESLEQLRTYFNLPLIGIVITGFKERWVDVNPRFCDMLGYTKAELLSKGQHDIIPAGFQVPEAALYRDFLRGEAQFPATFETQYVRKGGEIMHALVSTDVIKDAGGKVSRFVSFVQDITPQKLADLKIEQERRNLLAVFDSLPGFAHIQAPDYRIPYANQAFKKQFGEPEGRTCYACFQQREEPCDPCPTFEVFKTGKPNIWEMARSDGTVFLIHDVPFADTDGSPLVLEIGFDITERKRMEEDLKAKHNELERFTYSISHDLKSPLITIRTFAGALADDMARGDVHRVGKDLGYIDSASEKMNRMIDELLQLSRIGRMANEPVDTPMREIVNEATTLVAGRISEKNVRVELQETQVLHGDRTRLVEVFQNLLDNAVKFMDKQKEPRIEVGSLPMGGMSLCYVRDNGGGIDPRHIDRLFGMFEKLDPEAEGSGMGLALVKRIVEVHGGRIWAESEGLGKGACFWFTLPEKRSPN